MPLTLLTLTQHQTENGTAENVDGHLEKYDDEKTEGKVDAIEENRTASKPSRSKPGSEGSIKPLRTRRLAPGGGIQPTSLKSGLVVAAFTNSAAKLTYSCDELRQIGK
jgi:hypothetical protein